MTEVADPTDFVGDASFTSLSSAGGGMSLMTASTFTGRFPGVLSCLLSYRIKILA